MVNKRPPSVRPRRGPAPQPRRSADYEDWRPNSTPGRQPSLPPSSSLTNEAWSAWQPGAQSQGRGAPVTPATAQNRAAPPAPQSTAPARPQRPPAPLSSNATPVWTGYEDGAQNPGRGAPMTEQTREQRQGRGRTGSQPGGTPSPNTGRSEPNYNVPEWQRRNQAVFNQANTRELSTEEFDRLSKNQQGQVQLSTDLMAALREDIGPDGKGVSTQARGNVLSQLRLDPELEARLMSKLTVGTGPAVRESELFGQEAGAALRPSGYVAPEQSVLDRTGKTPTTTPGARGDRAATLDSITAKLPTYLAATSERRVAEALAQADAAKDSYQFGDEDAKIDFEEAFAYIATPGSLSGMDWATAAQGMRDVGYDPEDFKRYALDRIQMYPTTGQVTSLAELNAWFGTR